MRRAFVTLTAFSIVAGTAGVGCVVDNPAYEATALACDDGTLVRQQFAFAEPNALDVLIVVDDGPGMRDAQGNLSDAMPAFVDRLNAAGYDWQIGVVTMDMVSESDRGALVTGGQFGDPCPDLPTVITADMSDAGTLAACNVRLGQGGSDIEQGLEVVRRALRTDESAPNADFPRHEANTVVIVFSTEDDCSATTDLDQGEPFNCVWDPGSLKSVAELAGFFRIADKTTDGGAALSGQPISLVTVVGPSASETISAPTQPPSICSGSGQTQAGNRYAEAVDLLGETGFFYNICTPDYSQVMADIFTDVIEREADTVCLGAPATAAPNEVNLIESLSESPNVLADMIPGEDFIFLGETSDCANGAVSLARSTRTGDSADAAQIWFCSGQ